MDNELEKYLRYVLSLKSLEVDNQFQRYLHHKKKDAVSIEGLYMDSFVRARFNELSEFVSFLKALGGFIFFDDDTFVSIASDTLPVSSVEDRTVRVGSIPSDVTEANILKALDVLKDQTENIISLYDLQRKRSLHAIAITFRELSSVQPFISTIFTVNNHNLTDKQIMSTYQKILQMRTNVLSYEPGSLFEYKAGRLEFRIDRNRRNIQPILDSPVLFIESSNDSTFLRMKRPYDFAHMCQFVVEGSKEGSKEGLEMIKSKRILTVRKKEVVKEYLECAKKYEEKEMKKWEKNDYI